MDSLHRGPNTREATGLRSEGIHLVGALANVAENAFHRVGTAKRSMPHRWESRTREEMLFIFTHAPDGFGRALLGRGLECAHSEQRIFLLLLRPDACQFSCDLLPRTVGNGLEHGALCLHHTSLAWGCRTQRCDRSQESIMPIRDDQIDLGPSSMAQILEETPPAIGVFFGTRTSGQDVVVPLQIDAQGRDNDRGLGCGAVAHTNMDAIERQDAGMNETWAHAPGFTVVREGVGETTSALALGAPPLSVWATSPTVWGLVPETPISVNPSAPWCSYRWSRSKT
jgi:hypothetical protein